MINEMWKKCCSKFAIKRYRQNLHWQKYLTKRPIKNVTLSVLWLANNQFWKSPLFIFFAFIFPMIFIAILSNIMGYANLLSSNLSIPVTAVGSLALPTAVFEFRQSILLKRIGSTQISARRFLSIILFYYIGIMILGFLLCLIFALLIFANYFNNEYNFGSFNINYSLNFLPKIHQNENYFFHGLQYYLVNAQWGYYIYGLLLTIGIAAMFGLFIANVAKSVMMILALGTPVLIISLFLANQAITVGILLFLRPIVYVSYLSPFKSSVAIMIQAFQGDMAKQSQFYLSNLVQLLESQAFKDYLTNQGMSSDDLNLFLESIFKEFQINSEDLRSSTPWFTGISQYMFALQNYIGQGIYWSKTKGIADFFTQYNSNPSKFLNSNPASFLDSINPIDFNFPKDQNLVVNSHVLWNTSYTSPFNFERPYFVLSRAYDRLTLGYTILEKKLSIFLPYLWMLFFGYFAFRNFLWK